MHVVDIVITAIFQNSALLGMSGMLREHGKRDHVSNTSTQKRQKSRNKSGRKYAATR